MNTFEFMEYIKRIAVQHTHNQYLVLGNKKQHQYTMLEDRNEYKSTVKLYQYHTNICNYSMLCILLQGKCTSCPLKTKYFILKRLEEEYQEYLRFYKEYTESYVQFLFTKSLYEYMEDH